MHGGWAVVVAGVLATLAACDGGGPPKRGFGSRQLLATSDPTLNLHYVSGGAVRISLGTHPTNLAEYAVDLETGAMAPASNEIVKTERFDCIYESTSPGQTTLTITDSQSGATTRIEGVVQMPCPKAADEQLTAWRTESPDEVSVWTGTYDHLARVDLPMTIRAVGYPLNDAFPALAAPKDEPDALGFYQLASKTFAATEVIPARLASWAVAEGGVVSGEVVSSHLAKEFPTRTSLGRYLYVRELADGRRVTFAGPFEDGPRELAVRPSEPQDSIDARVVFTDGGPQTWIEADPTDGLVQVWDDRRGRLISCPWLDRGFVAGRTTVDRRRVLIGGANGQDRRESGLLLVSLDAATREAACTTLADAEVTEGGFSPSGERLFWIGGGKDLQWGLRLADGDGANMRLLDPVRFFMEQGRFISETHLEVKLGGDLVWLDASQPNPAMHFVAEKVFGYPLDLEGNKVITGYDFSPQDGNGRLGLVDRETGTKQLVSPAVSEYLSLSPGEAGTWLLAYVVRGRNPSSQDGLWIATFSAEDLR